MKIRIIAGILWRLIRAQFQPLPEKLPQCDILSIASDPDRGFLFGGKYYSPLVDSIEYYLRSAGARSVCVAKLLSDKRGSLAYGDVFGLDRDFSWALIEKKIKKVLGLGGNFSTLEKRIWTRILDQTGAKRVFGILPSKELCAACHERGVWVSDVQHGVIADDSSTLPYYDVNIRAREPREWLPDVFLCWDEGSKGVFATWGERGIAVDAWVIGNPWLVRFQVDSPNDDLVREVAASDQRVFGDDGRPVVLVTLQWGLSELPNGLMPESLVAAIRSTSDEYRWMIRLHPNQVNGVAMHEGGQFAKLFETSLAGHAEWEWSTSMPLPIVLRRANCHITWHSSTVIEASLMKIKSGLLSPMLLEGGDMASCYSYQRESQMAFILRDSREDIVEWLAHHGNGRISACDLVEAEVRLLRLVDFLLEEQSR